jgi:hypothetical protein
VGDRRSARVNRILPRSANNRIANTAPVQQTRIRAASTMARLSPWVPSLRGANGARNRSRNDLPGLGRERIPRHQDNTARMRRGPTRGLQRKVARGGGDGRWSSDQKSGGDGKLIGMEGLELAIEVEAARILQGLWVHSRLQVNDSKARLAHQGEMLCRTKTVLMSDRTVEHPPPPSRKLEKIDGTYPRIEMVPMVPPRQLPAPSRPNPSSRRVRTYRTPWHNRSVFSTPTLAFAPQRAFRRYPAGTWERMRCPMHLSH